MKIKSCTIFMVTGLCASFLLSMPVYGQMRPECIASLTKPGACFEYFEPGEIFIGCGFPGEGDVVEGIFVWTDWGKGENDFNRVNPDGTLFTHISNKDVSAVFCPWDTVFAGLCTPDSAAPELLYYGTVDLQANGVVISTTESGCPFIITSKGSVTRPDDGDTIEVQPTLKTVVDKDSPTGCRVQTCRIFRLGKNDAE